MAVVGTSSSDFLFGDDFDAIFEALEEDEEFEDYLEVVVEEVNARVYKYALISRDYYDLYSILDANSRLTVSLYRS